MDRAGWCSHCQWRPPLLYSSIILYAQNEKPNPTPPKQKNYKKKKAQKTVSNFKNPKNTLQNPPLALLLYSTFTDPNKHVV